MNLSVTGSRNAPERVAPSRRASQPSRLSVDVIANQRPTVVQFEPCVADQQERRDRDDEAQQGDEVGRRGERTLTEPPGRRRGHRLPVTRRASRSGPIASVTAHLHGRAGSSVGPHDADDTVDLRRFAVRPADETVVVAPVDEHLDRLAHERGACSRP